MTATNSFVIFPMGEKHFALPADRVTELARVDQQQVLPHTTPFITGVLVRRNEVIPVWDIAPSLVGPDAPARKFYLIARRRFGSTEECSAIPVTGDCELLNQEITAPVGKVAPYVEGLLSLQNELVEVINLEKLATEVAS
ncbi:MAG TPA: chemotaxis protein CheW [Terriglobales bacterium]|nr:chemotaxis protein CheW [Terriglobales bacterium]